MSDIAVAGRPRRAVPCDGEPVGLMDPHFSQTRGLWAADARWYVAAWPQSKPAAALTPVAVGWPDGAARLGGMAPGLRRSGLPALAAGGTRAGAPARRARTCARRGHAADQPVRRAGPGRDRRADRASAPGRRARPAGRAG